MIKAVVGALSEDELDELYEQVTKSAAEGRGKDAEASLEPLLQAQGNQPEAALCLAAIVEDGHLPRELALDLLVKVYEAHENNPRVMGVLGQALEQARDIDMLNAPPPEHPLFENAINTLIALAATTKGSDDERGVLKGLATAARVMARRHDLLAEDSFRRLIEIEPNESNSHYNLGLFFKTRGRFTEGVAANRAAATLEEEPSEACRWNLGICATGAGQSDVALEVWKQVDQRVQLGRFGLPEAEYANVMVRLAERPLAERTVDADDPGVEESIWIERLSPCHGIVRSVYIRSWG